MDRDFSRRQMTGNLLRASGAAAASAALAFWLSRRRPAPPDGALPELLARRNLSVPADAALPSLAIAKGHHPPATLRAAIDALGGIRRFISRGDVVVIKPNAAWDRTPEQAANTHPAIVGELVRLCFEAGAKTVSVAEVPVSDARSAYERSGIAAAVRSAGGTLVYPEQRLFREVDFRGEVLEAWPVLRPFLEADKLINVPVAKHHSLTGATLGIKNLYGVIGGQRRRLHQRIHESLADLVDFFRPTLTVIDAWRVLLRNGPSGGNPADAAEFKTVAASVDPVAADAWAAAEFFRLEAARLPYLQMAAARGAGAADLKNVSTRIVSL